MLALRIRLRSASMLSDCLLRASSMIMSRKSVTAVAGAWTSCRRNAVNARLSRSSDALSLLPHGTARMGLAFPGAEKALHLANKSIDFCGVGIVVIASGLDRLFSITAHGVRGEPNYRHSPRGVVSLETSSRFPALHYRETHIHQDDGRLLAVSEVDPLFAVRCEDDLKTATREATR